MYGPSGGELAGAVGCLLVIGAVLCLAVLWLLAHLHIQIAWL